METLAGKALNDLANLAAEKWYAGVGAVGLVIVLTALLKGTPHNDVMVGAIGAAMSGFGFGEAETRTHRERVDPYMRYKITSPARRITFAGVFLYIIGLAGVIVAFSHSNLF